MITVTQAKALFVLEAYRAAKRIHHPFSEEARS